MSGAATSEPIAAERRDVVALARELARRELAPQALALDERRLGAFEAAWKPIAASGYDRALLATEDGGVGLDAGSLLGCVEELAAGEPGVALQILLSNAALAALPAERAARIGAAERWAFVPAPPDQVATPARLATSARRDAPLVLAGTLSPALGALGADGIVIAQGGEKPAVLALEAEAPGLTIEACEDQLGLRAAAAARISISPSAEAVATPAGPSAPASMTLLRAGSAAIARGIIGRANELGLAYACTRQQGGVAIVEHDAVRRMLAAMAVGLDSLSAPADVVLDESATLAVKVATTEAAVAASTDAVQVFGGTGYMRETGVEKLMRDAKYLQLWPEPNWAADDAIVAAALGDR